MFCPFCGKKVKQDYRYCAYCGVNLKVEDAQTKKDSISKSESRIRQSLALLLLALVISMPLANPIGLQFAIPLAVIFLPVSLYLVRSRKRHLVLECFLFFLGLVLYTFNLPIFLPAPLSYLKGLIMSADWTDRMTFIFLAFFFSKVLFFATTAYLLLSGIFAGLSSFSEARRYSAANLALFGLILVTTFALPFLKTVRIEPGPAIGVGVGGRGSFEVVYVVYDERQGRRAASVLEVDPQRNQWVYKIQLKNSTRDRAEVTRITSSGKQIAPPFGDNLVVVGAEKTAEKLEVPPGAAFQIMYFSAEPLWEIKLWEKTGGSYQFSFWQ